MSQSNRPAIQKTVVTSAARTTSSNSGNLKDTATDFPANAKTVALHFKVTAYTVDGAKATGQARFYVQTSPDGGTTWNKAAVAAAVTSSTADRVIVFRNGVPDGVNSIDEFKNDHTLQTTTAQMPILYPLAADKRIAWELGDGSTGGTGISVTFACYVSSDCD